MGSHAGAGHTALPHGHTTKVLSPRCPLACILRSAPYGLLSQEENTMNHRSHRTLGMMALVCLLGVSQSWGGPPNNDVSDALGNTAGGSAALFSNTTGFYNTAFGLNALFSNSIGGAHTPLCLNALFRYTTRSRNTA